MMGKLAAAYARAGRPDRAVAVATRALELGPFRRRKRKFPGRQSGGAASGFSGGRPTAFTSAKCQRTGRASANTTPYYHV
jgi:hypothetical protein